MRPWEGPMKEAITNAMDDKVKFFNISSVQSKLVQWFLMDVIPVLGQSAIKYQKQPDKSKVSKFLFCFMRQSKKWNESPKEAWDINDWDLFLNVMKS